MAIASNQANTKIPQVFSGPRGVFRIGDNPVGYAGNVSGEETIK